ncbi:MAG: hypothetical protein Q8Q04_03760 [archaeon]|nr:hypothetical protein [archaeon]
MIFGFSQAPAQDKGSVFTLKGHENDIMRRVFISSKEGGLTDIVRYELDIEPKNGKLDLNAYFWVKGYNLKDGTIDIDSTAFLIQKDYDEDGKTDYAIQDVDGNGTLETLVYEKKKYEKNFKPEKLNKSQIF